MEYTLPSVDGKSTLHGIQMNPQCEPKGIVIFTTGMAEHMGRYRQYMQRLTARGLICLGHNYIGHKDSMPNDVDLGHMPMRDGMNIIVEDLLADSRRIKEKYPNLPLVLFGHSMGSLVARVTLSRAERGLYQAAVICGTAGPNPIAPYGIQLIKLVGHIKGERYVSDFCENLIFGSYNKRTAKRTTFDWLTTDEHEVDLYLNDKYCGFRFTVGALVTLVKFSILANTAKNYRNIDKKMPLLMIIGMEDVVTDYGAGAKKVEAAFRKFGQRDVTAKYYPNVRHELHNEPIREQVFADVGEWIVDKLG